MSDVPYELVGSDEGFCHSPWFNACRRNHIPYVVIRQGGQSADVLWDFVTLPLACDRDIRRTWPILAQEVRAIFQRHAGEESFLRAKPSLIAFDHLPIEDARCAAGELYVLIASYLPEAHTYLMLPRRCEASSPENTASDTATPRPATTPQQASRTPPVEVTDAA